MRHVTAEGFRIVAECAGIRFSPHESVRVRAEFVENSREIGIDPRRFVSMPFQIRLNPAARVTEPCAVHRPLASPDFALPE
jgi:hypothetical protein